MNAQFDEELVHLAQIGGVAVGVKKSGSGHRVPDIHSHNLVTSARGELENLHVFSVRKRTEQQQTGQLVSDRFIRGRVGREKGELGRH